MVYRHANCVHFVRKTELSYMSPRPGTGIRFQHNDRFLGTVPGTMRH
jgi:hypothetical protein